jgi:indole-3-glycerol phosphate synthase
MSEALAPYYAAAQQEAQTREVSVSLGDLERLIDGLIDPQPHFIRDLISSTGVAVIAEHKRRSPSDGEIRAGSDVAWAVEQYQQGGAVAVSVVTQQAHFGGAVEDLARAREAVDLPILRKDFISTPYQLYEARAFGADAALLIVGGLSDAELLSLHREAGNIGLDCLVEVHDEQELSRAFEIHPDVIGINNRNLATMEVDLETTRNLAQKVPQDIVLVAESGYDVGNPAHMRELRALDVDAVLIGTALMREENPAGVLRTWIDS